MALVSWHLQMEHVTFYGLALSCVDFKWLAQQVNKIKLMDTVTLPFLSFLSFRSFFILQLIFAVAWCNLKMLSLAETAQLLTACLPIFFLNI